MDLTLETVQFLNKVHSSVRIVAITPEISAAIMSKAIAFGVTSYVLKSATKRRLKKRFANLNWETVYLW